jgi:hypothetical protein
MAAEPLELTLSLQPESRRDAIDVARRIRQERGDVLATYHKVQYCSLHTTAGYLEQGLARRLGHRRDRVEPFLGTFHRLFPHAAGYRHDRMEERRELSAAQRSVEPRNADAHLTFIGSGLQSCVTYRHRCDEPVFFLELDGVCEGRVRTRTTSVVGYNEEAVVARARFEVAVADHPIDSVNLWDRRLGLADAIRDLLLAHPVSLGRLDVALDPDEQSAAITVNEYETLLMRHDVAEVLRDPLRYFASQSRRMLADPRAVPAKSLGYARYDLVQLLKQTVDALGLRESAVERVVTRLMALPAKRILRLKRSVRLPVSSSGDGFPRVVRGPYQSPILIQWRRAARGARTLHLSLSRFR